MKTDLRPSTSPTLAVARSIPFRDNLKVKKSPFQVVRFKVLNAKAGTYEAWVSIFGNVDLQGERVLPGYFTKSLDTWRQAADPVPSIYSHMWDDPFAHIGYADPDALEEDEIGLHVREAHVDIDKPFAGQVFDLMAARRLREFSFAHDVQEENRAKDGAIDLIQGDLIEFGPTLKGANPDTVLAGTKALRDALDREIVGLQKFAGVVKPELKKADQKAHVQLAGSIESGLSAIARATNDWAMDTFGRDLFWSYLEATFDDRVVAYVELFDDPWDGGRFYQIPYSKAEDGAVTMGEPEEVVIEGAVTPAPDRSAKGRRWKEGRRNASADADRLQSAHDLMIDLGAECASVSDDSVSTDSGEDNAKDRGSDNAKDPRPGVISVLAEVEALKVGLEG